MKIGLLSLGCPKNLVDGEVMLGYARAAGHDITPDARWYAYSYVRDLSDLYLVDGLR